MPPIPLFQCLEYPLNLYRKQVSEVLETSIGDTKFSSLIFDI